MSASEKHRQFPLLDKCIFCGGGGVRGNRMSGEHLWSDWMKELFPDLLSGSEYFEFWEIHQGKDRVPRTPRFERTKQGAPHRKKIKAVCERCNNGWMSTIETDAKPILTSLIHGEHIILKNEDRCNLSVWISLKILVTENNSYYGYDADPIFDFGTRERFKHTRSVPDGFKIWIAPHKGAKWRLGYHRHAAGLWAAPTAPKYRGTPKNIQSITWGVGKLLIYVLATTDAKVYGMLDLMGPTAPIQLWPLTTNDIVWPGNFSLTDEGADVLTRVLDTLIASPGVLWAAPSD